MLENNIDNDYRWHCQTKHEEKGRRKAIPFTKRHVEQKIASLTWALGPITRHCDLKGSDAGRPEAVPLLKAQPKASIFIHKHGPFNAPSLLKQLLISSWLNVLSPPVGHHQ
ncbi:MAG: hypothetical protein ACNS62_02670 [Candidatus Cyclobacteriaceae bacterium M3_2C_046]